MQQSDVLYRGPGMLRLGGSHTYTVSRWALDMSPTLTTQSDRMTVPQWSCPPIPPAVFIVHRTGPAGG